MTFRTLQLPLRKPRSAPAPPLPPRLPRAVTSAERAHRDAQNAAAIAALRATLLPPSRQSSALASLLSRSLHQQGPFYFGPEQTKKRKWWRRDDEEECCGLPVGGSWKWLAA
ncbi:hypothetical protein QC762_0113740 [Podospora pseudocomata]|uniref:Uncharacterized protein n=1 Tax=Podospora pseudocomata TaxID=2093779 RepID=A0ABR0G4Z3_9PEZI|nr:hypothetical protein QC762_0113740 [Podospora pseudocomata]